MTTPRDSYDAMAPGYDQYTRANDYEMWLGEVLLPEMERHGLRRGRALDVGCGTGRAFPPLLNRGWEVVGCDVSPAMLEQARLKFGDAVPLSVADLRELPVLGEFRLVLCLNDTINYLTGDGDLARALPGLRANLAPGGLLLLDANTLSAFREMYSAEGEPGGTYETIVSGEGMEPHPHRQRHYPVDQLAEAMAAARLDCLAMLGQREDGGRVLLGEAPNEGRDMKVVCIAGPGWPVPISRSVSDGHRGA